MNLELTETRGIPLATGLRWGAVLSGFAVGGASYLLLMLAGVATGLAVAGESPPTQGLPAMAAVWSFGAMIVSAAIGGFFAARSSGLRRGSDGVVHGVVTWAATVITLAVLASTAAGAAFGGLFKASLAVAGPASVAIAPSALPDIVRQLRDGDRDAAVRTLQSYAGLSREQAVRLIDGPISEGLRDLSASPATDTAAKASAWLLASMVISLISGALGGRLGVLPERRFTRSEAAYLGRRQNESTP